MKESVMKQETPPALGLIGHRFVRCLITATFIAAFSTACINLLGLAPASQQAYLFLLILFAGFLGAQVQERMFRIAAQT